MRKQHFLCKATRLKKIFFGTLTLTKSLFPNFIACLIKYANIYSFRHDHETKMNPFDLFYQNIYKGLQNYRNLCILNTWY